MASCRHCARAVRGDPTTVGLRAWRCPYDRRVDGQGGDHTTAGSTDIAVSVAHRIRGDDAPGADAVDHAVNDAHATLEVLL
eukprot:scaffold113506_cov33-Tisochrysis_lutea.AAC.5